MRDAYPLPYISIILDRLGDAKYLSTIDIKSAYWHIHIGRGVYEVYSFRRTEPGIVPVQEDAIWTTQCTRTFQRLIDNVTGHDLEPSVFPCLDDVIVVTSTIEEHLKVLGQVLKHLRGARLTFNREKCHVCKDKLRYSTPKNQTGVRKIIGMASWYRRFLPEFSTIIAPLSTLLRKNTKFVWTKGCE